MFFDEARKGKIMATEKVQSVGSVEYSASKTVNSNNKVIRPKNSVFAIKVKYLQDKAALDAEKDILEGKSTAQAEADKFKAAAEKKGVKPWDKDSNMTKAAFFSLIADTQNAKPLSDKENRKFLKAIFGKKNAKEMDQTGDNIINSDEMRSKLTLGINKASKCDNDTDTKIIISLDENAFFTEKGEYIE